MKTGRLTRWVPAAFMIALMLSLSFAEAFAQRAGRQGPPDAEALQQRVENRVAFLTATLELTEQQQAQVQEILTDIHNQRRALMAEREPGERGRPGAREEMAQFDAEVRTRMESVLTPEQFARYEELRPRMRGDQRMRQRPERGADRQRPGRSTGRERPMGLLGGQQFSAVQQELNLTDDQVAEIRNILQDARREFRSTGEDRQRVDREQRHAMMRSVVDQVTEVLTEEQIEQLSELRTEYRERWQEKRGDTRKRR